ncbi:LPD7 domain-containing protein [Massilia sp. LXY-6]|uniref:LPD7 domain-containing protein n=1 Tax=Massilia sp. LXY-6 TaxID=3379823 RepID=UPI003EDEB1D6
MLIRVRGGRGGIKEYLESGHKQGREFQRDELDERIILFGDLEFTQQLIDSVESQGDRYLHLTLSFKEDEISNETLRAISEEFRLFMFSAYMDDEYNFYAEAHLPKIKSYESQLTGEVIERKPHIHIVIPKVNLRSGGVLNPFGLLELSKRHVDAFQEHINNIYGLASPKDNRRIHFTDMSDMIQRYKEYDNFAGVSKDLKRAILDAVVERNVTSYDDFEKLVSEFGTTRIRNAGRGNEYLNVKPNGAAKGVNLKDYPFSRQFIELPAGEKQRVLSAEIQRNYEIQGEARKDSTNIVTTLDEWHRFRAKEIKYVNSGNKKLYRDYRAASPEGREQILSALAARFYDKYPEPWIEPEAFAGKNPFDPRYKFKQLADVPTQLPLFDEVVREPSDEPRQPVGRAVIRPKGLEGQGSAGVYSAALPHPQRQQEPLVLSAFEQTYALRMDGAALVQDLKMKAYGGKNPVGHDHGIVDHAGRLDGLTDDPSRQRADAQLAAFEQSHTLSQMHSVPPGHAAVATPAPTFDHLNQELRHERQRYAGKNPIGHEYGYKQPHWSERNPIEDASGKPAERRWSGTGGYGAGDGTRGTGRPGQAGRSRRGQLAGNPDREYDIDSLISVEKTRTVDRLRSLPGGRMVRQDRKGAVLLPAHALDQLGNWPSGSNHNLRRSRHRQPVKEGTGRVSDSVVSQLARDFGERQRSVAAGALAEFQEIKQQLDARRLLAELSHSHGIIVEKYEVSTAADGSARIRASNRHLNVADFLTKEVRLPWTEAATILRYSYGRQLDRNQTSSPRVPPDRTLWRQFQDQRRGRGGLRSQLAVQLASEKARREVIKEQLVEAKRAAAALPAAQRKAALSIARTEAIAAESTLRSSIRAERAPFRLPVADQYRMFLQERAQDGRAAALAELRRRSRSAPSRRDPSVNQILAAEANHESNSLFYHGRQVRYRVHLNGDVVYSLGGRPIIQDKGDSVLLLQADHLSIETALQLAHAKFGTNLKLSGPVEFQERAARIAAEAGLNVRFDNQLAEEVRELRASEMATQRTTRRRVIETQTKPKLGIGGDTGNAVQPGRGVLHRPSPGRSLDDDEIEL